MFHLNQLTWAAVDPLCRAYRCWIMVWLELWALASILNTWKSCPSESAQNSSSPLRERKKERERWGDGSVCCMHTCCWKTKQWYVSRHWYEPGSGLSLHHHFSFVLNEPVTSTQLLATCTQTHYTTGYMQHLGSQFKFEFVSQVVLL